MINMTVTWETGEWTAREAVAHGVNMLDLRLPGWRGFIDGYDLDISNGERCLAAQLFGYDSYNDSIKLLTGRSYGQAEWAADHGFSTPGSSGADWDDLQREWLAVLGVAEEDTRKYQEDHEDDDDYEGESVDQGNQHAG